MDVEGLFELARPYLEKNDLGVAHTRRVFAVAQENFDVPSELQELTFSSIILHDIGGGSIRDQYQKGPKIAVSVLRRLGYKKGFIEEVCEIIRTHHDHPDNPALPFRVLYDSDRLVMFSPEEFPYYNSVSDFDWNKIVNLIYSEHIRQLAVEILKKRQNETC
jgi:hypothetical protein